MQEGLCGGPGSEYLSAPSTQTVSAVYTRATTSGQDGCITGNSAHDAHGVSHHGRPTTGKPQQRFHHHPVKCANSLVNVSFDAHAVPLTQICCSLCVCVCVCVCVCMCFIYLEDHTVKLNTHEKILECLVLLFSAVASEMRTCRLSACRKRPS